MINDIITTAIVNSVIGKPLYSFGCDGIILDAFHRSACIEELWQEAKYADEDEIESLNILEHFILSAPIGVDLNSAECDDLGNYIPKGWKHV